MDAIPRHRVVDATPHAVSFAALSPALVEMQRQQVETPAHILADAWREGHRSIDAMLRAIKQDRRIISEQYREILPGKLKHSLRFVAQTKAGLAVHLRKYAEAVRVVSEAEAEMDERELPYALSSDDWRADPMLAAAVFCGGLV